MTKKTVILGVAALVVVAVLGWALSTSTADPAMKALLIGSGFTVGAMIGLSIFIIKEITYIRAELRMERHRATLRHIELQERLSRENR